MSMVVFMEQYFYKNGLPSMRRKGKGERGKGKGSFPRCPDIMLLSIARSALQLTCKRNAPVGRLLGKGVYVRRVSVRVLSLLLLLLSFSAGAHADSVLVPYGFDSTLPSAEDGFH